jgi:hypothetical protein
MAYHMQGTTLESCNCDAICPCRKIDGVPGGRSTHGECEGVLSWLIRNGEVDGVDVSGLAVAIAFWYGDDEPGSPWRWMLHVDDRGDDAQRAALADVFTGRLGGTALRQFPWVRKGSDLLSVVTSTIDVDHTEGRGSLRVGSGLAFVVDRPYPTASTVACIIPGYDQPGRELIASVLEADDEPFHFRYEGTCGFESSFDYSSES